MRQLNENRPGLHTAQNQSLDFIVETWPKEMQEAKARMHCSYNQYTGERNITGLRQMVEPY